MTKDEYTRLIHALVGELLEWDEEAANLGMNRDWLVPEKLVLDGRVRRVITRFDACLESLSAMRATFHDEAMKEPTP